MWQAVPLAYLRQAAAIFIMEEDTDYFVITSNGEGHFIPCVFSPEKVFEMEGRLTEYRCAQNCHDTVYNNRKDVVSMPRRREMAGFPSPHIATPNAAL
ncbi:MAG: hypothetical protein HFH58_16945 [Lachnospiraceae bacterium]|nr:hypothetical protein [Lachnospiraceae bacterium]